MAKMRVDYQLDGGIARLFECLKIDPSDWAHLGLYELQLWFLPLGSGSPRWWTMVDTEGSIAYVQLDIRPVFKGLSRKRVIRKISVLDCVTETCPARSAVIRESQVVLVDWLLNCPGRALVIRRRSKPARVMSLASRLISRSLDGSIGMASLNKRFGDLITITQYS